jgi:DNA topoisomerase I
MYKNKAKNAQEAHECIRPTDMDLDPGKLKLREDDQRKLYDLIWKRTIASQMAAARLERTTVDVASQDGQVELRATGQVVLFDGFIRIYEEGRDEPEGEDDGRLPQIMEGEPAAKRSVTPEQHFTQPPPRYTEATLVKRMEELGIGRPSTYASIVTTIQEREYVRKDKGRLIPEDKGRLVTAFLSNYFRKYVGYDFTADLEAELDDVSAGDRDWKDVLSRFWRDFSAALAETADLRISEVLEKIDEVLAPHLFPPREDGADPRVCPTCGVGRLNLKTARSGGAFIGCSNYPECRYTRRCPPRAARRARRPSGCWARRGRAHPPQGRALRALCPARRGDRGGAQAAAREPAQGLAARCDGPRARADALEPAARDRAAPGGRRAGRGRDRPLRALRQARPGLCQPARGGRGLHHRDEPRGRGAGAEGEPGSGARRRTAAKALKELGEHPAGGPVAVMEGRYGPYVKWGKVNATLPKDTDPAELTMDAAVELLARRRARRAGRRRRHRARRRPRPPLQRNLRPRSPLRRRRRRRRQRRAHDALQRGD